MRFIQKDDIKLPMIGIGTYMIGNDEAEANNELNVLEYGLENYGMTLIDTAEMYGNGKSEQLISKFLKKHNRNEIYIIDKILPENAEKGLYLDSCKKSLDRLGVDYIDLYLLHWRSNVNLQDMVDNMEHLVSLGLIKKWGVSNFDVDDMEDLFKCKNGNHCFLNQCLYNLSSRGVEYDLIPWCKSHNVIFMAYSPLAHNSIYKKVLNNSNELNYIIKNNYQCLENLLLKFVVRNNDIITVFKTSNILHLKDTLHEVFKPFAKDELAIIEKCFPAPKCKVPLEKI